MPSFLSKVFGRKKEDGGAGGSKSPGGLLEGKFEKVSPTVSPSAETFAEVNGDGKKADKDSKEKDKDTAFAIFRAKSRPSTTDSPVHQQGQQQRKPIDSLPTLNLNLSLPQVKVSGESSPLTELGNVFEGDSDAKLLLTDAVIGERRLTPQETLSLVRACSDVITSRGLETLGLMHPHWYSASPDIQRRLISLFLHSLTAPSATPSPSSPLQSTFASELDSTRSPHDVAAILRWGLRHLQIPAPAFGNTENWYTTFFDAEQKESYPPKAFSEQLAPLVPEANLNLLTTTLELLSSLAAHAEANGTSGSKLSKLFGLWLLSVQRVEANDDWTHFYERWERNGRILEHLFLARIRDEAAHQRMPTRLMELVRAYPYSKSPAQDGLLPRPRFSTRQYDALFIRVETELSPKGKGKQNIPPLQIVSIALSSSSSTPNEDDAAEIWTKIKAAASATASSSDSTTELSNIFADETIRFLTLLPNATTDNKEPLSPSFSVYPPGSKIPNHRRSLDKDASASSPSQSNALSSTNGHSKMTTDPSPISTSPSATGKTPVTAASSIGTDWTQFSNSGFFESNTGSIAATLFDQDVEVTKPPTPKSPVSRKSSIRRKGSVGRKSVDVPRVAVASNDTTPKDEKAPSKTTLVSLLKLDEAFIDFWADALLDPIVKDWPAFVICKLKSSAPELGALTVGEDKRRLEWIVLEHVHSSPPPPAPSASSAKKNSPSASEDGETVGAGRPRPSSPKPSYISETKKRFSFFTSSSSRAHSSSSVSNVKDKGKKKGAAIRIGEMGEILPEVNEEVEKKKKSETVKVKIPTPKSKKSMGDVKEAPKIVPHVPVLDAESKPEEEDKLNDTPSNGEVAAVAIGTVALGGAAVLAATLTGTKDLGPSTEAPTAVPSETDAPTKEIISADEPSSEDITTPVVPTEPSKEITSSTDPEVAVVPTEAAVDTAVEPSVLTTEPISKEEELTPVDITAPVEDVLIAATAIEPPTEASMEDAPVRSDIPDVRIEPTTDAADEPTAAAPVQITSDDITEPTIGVQEEPTETPIETIEAHNEPVSEAPIETVTADAPSPEPAAPPGLNTEGDHPKQLEPITDTLTEPIPESSSDSQIAVDAPKESGFEKKKDSAAVVKEPEPPVLASEVSEAAEVTKPKEISPVEPEPVVAPSVDDITSATVEEVVPEAPAPGVSDSVDAIEESISPPLVEELSASKAPVVAVEETASMEPQSTVEPTAVEESVQVHVPNDVDSVAQPEPSVELVDETPVSPSKASNSVDVPVTGTPDAAIPGQPEIVKAPLSALRLEEPVAKELSAVGEHDSSKALPEETVDAVLASKVEKSTPTVEHQSTEQSVTSVPAEDANIDTGLSTTTEKPTIETALNVDGSTSIVESKSVETPISTGPNEETAVAVPTSEAYDSAAAVEPETLEKPFNLAPAEEPEVEAPAPVVTTGVEQPKSVEETASSVGTKEPVVEAQVPEAVEPPAAVEPEPTEKLFNVAPAPVVAVEVEQPKSVEEPASSILTKDPVVEANVPEAVDPSAAIVPEPTDVPASSADTPAAHDRADEEPVLKHPSSEDNEVDNTASEAATAVLEPEIKVPITLAGEECVIKEPAVETSTTEVTDSSTGNEPDHDKELPPTAEPTSEIPAPTPLDSHRAQESTSLLLTEANGQGVSTFDIVQDEQSPESIEIIEPTPTIEEPSFIREQEATTHIPGPEPIMEEIPHAEEERPAEVASASDLHSVVFEHDTDIEPAGVPSEPVLEPEDDAQAVLEEGPFEVANVISTEPRIQSLDPGNDAGSSHIDIPAVPIVHSELVLPVAGSLQITTPLAEESSTEIPPAEETASATEHQEEPALKSHDVILSGSTPGPQVALNIDKSHAHDERGNFIAEQDVGEPEDEASAVSNGIHEEKISDIAAVDDNSVTVADKLHESESVPSKEVPESTADLQENLVSEQLPTESNA